MENQAQPPSQQPPPPPNRYAHLIPAQNKSYQQQQITRPVPTKVAIDHNNANRTYVPQQQQTSANVSTNFKSKPPPLGAHAVGSGQHSRAQANYYYNSFSTVDWREQWIILKEKILEKVEEPHAQRQLILFIVCCALLLDNMLYMVVVPIVPHYLRESGTWETYIKDGKWNHHNVSDRTIWDVTGGTIIYEGEETAIGFLFASKAIVQLFVNPFSGAIIDRIGYEIPMMFGLIVMFFSTMVFACGQTYSILLLARSLQGLGSAFADTSGLAMIADRFSEENERQRALGIALAFISFGCLFAPPFGSILYAIAGKEVPFIILSLVCLLDGSLLLLVAPSGTFSQLSPSYKPPSVLTTTTTNTTTTTSLHSPTSPRLEQWAGGGGSGAPQDSPIASASSLPNTQSTDQEAAGGVAASPKPKNLQRQKSISRRQSMTVASAGEAPKGTPIHVLFRDPCIACCAGALVVANVSLAFLEPTITNWIEDTWKDAEKWQVGMIWLPAFIPHILGVYSTVKLADKYPRYQWLIAAIGLVLEGFACLMVPFCTNFWTLIIPISLLCFGLALIDTAILPTLGFLVDTRYVSVYGSIYAIADISYSASYAVGPIIAGGIVGEIGFTALNFLIAIITIGYTPTLVMLRSIHDYEPFEADNTGTKKKKAKELAPFGQFGRQAIDEEDEVAERPAWSSDGRGDGTLASPASNSNNNSADYNQSFTSTSTQPAHSPAAGGGVAGTAGGHAHAQAQGKYESPRWAMGASQEAPMAPRKSALVKKSSAGNSTDKEQQQEHLGRSRHSVKIVEGRGQQLASSFVEGGDSKSQSFATRNPFVGSEQ